MVPLEAHLRAQRDAGRRLLVPYMTGGLGGPAWIESLLAMAASGADAIEVGIPFSDPAMDGPTIQEASQAALDGGATPPKILDSLRGVDVGVPLIVMTYYNLCFRAGHERFAASLLDAGINGAILPDLPLEESAGWEATAADTGVASILLASPITPDDRLAQIAQRSTGFVYGVSLMGVTGERGTLPASAAVIGARLKAVTETPVLIGFGVSTPAHAVEASEHADGVVVASALMRLLLDGKGPDAVGEAVADMRVALDGASR
ncbi:MAG TPA: tryptophan synthase subunit alpha [Acidimicrobiales bacterium]|nr:tryptophan synthase subunit alpha [Acidimicrobiales bacterium]